MMVEEQSRARKHSKDTWILAGAGVVTVACVGAVLIRMRLAVAAQSAALPQPAFLAESAHALIGDRASYLGDVSSAYTLVEFADYECPPCRSLSPQVAALVGRHAGKLRVTYRNFPLTKIHPHAWEAATAAEAAREQGRFWPVHDALYAEQGDLTSERINAIALANGLDKARFDRIRRTTAKLAVQADAQRADSLGLQGTPSFLLCCPDGRVVKLGVLAQAENYIR